MPTPMPRKPGFTVKTRELFTRLKLDVVSLHAKWQLYMDLFTDPDRILIINKTVPSVYQLLEESLRDDMTMSFGRLLDPFQTGKDTNLTNLSLKWLMNQVQEIEVGFHATILLKYEDFCKHCKAIIKWRNRRVGHNDLRTAMKTHADPLPGIKKSFIDDAMKMLADIMNAVDQHFEGGVTPYDAVIMYGTGADLVDCYLKRALDSDEEEKRKSRRGAR